MKQKLTFSGHETFYCRYLWLKKGYEFVKNSGSFRDELATVKLGVGKNMVTSIRYWMQAFGLIDNKGLLTQFAKMILDDKGFDPYLERIGSVWLLHYNLVKTNYASIYSIFFNRFRKEYIEFTYDQLLYSLIELCNENENKYSENTIRSDIDILIKNYKTPNSKKNLEEDYTSLLSDLNLITEVISNNSPVYKIENYFIEDLDANIILYSILNEYENNISVSINDLASNNIGNIFLLNREKLTKKIIEAKERYKKAIVYNDDAGASEMQIKDHTLDKYHILEDYYAS